MTQTEETQTEDIAPDALTEPAAARQLPTAPPTRPRSAVERLVDTLSTKVFRLPPQRSDYTVTQGIRVAMRDGVHLLTDHYAPTTPAVGTILMRGPYRRFGALPHIMLGLWASRGYHVVMQSCRGTFGSEGTFEPGGHEIADGADTVAWLREQPWYGGQFVAVGGSYLSYTMWSMLMDPPADLAGALGYVSFHDFHRAVHGTGAFALNDIACWYDALANQERFGTLRSLVHQAQTTRRLRAALGALPVADIAERYLGVGGTSAEWYREWAVRGEASDPYWVHRDLTPALDRVDVPVKLVSGWQDIFLNQTLEEYERLRERGVDVRLTVGPWTHANLLTKGGSTVLSECLGWVDELVGAYGASAGRPGAPVSYYVTGAEQWRRTASWPPPSASHRVLHLDVAGALSDAVPSATAPAAHFTYDPADPTPTVGGRLLTPDSGYKDDSSLARRPDVLTFTSAPLTDACEVVGVPTLRLRHTSDNVCCDLWVRVSEVDQKGRSRNVTDDYRRLRADEVDGTVVLGLDPMAHRFAAGSRIRLYVGGGSYPRLSRNLGTPGNQSTSIAMTPSLRTVELAGGASTLTLPCA